MRKRFVGAILAIVVIMMVDSVLALLQSTTTIPSSGTIEPQGGQGQVQKSEAICFDAYYDSAGEEGFIVRDVPSGHRLYS